MSVEPQRVRNLDRQTVVAERVQIAKGFFSRLLGLLPRSSIDAEEGLYLVPCTAIHTAMMRFPIDVAFLDAEGRVLKIVANLAPWGAAGPVAGAEGVLELSAGRLAAVGVQLGDRLRFEDVPVRV